MEPTEGEVFGDFEVETQQPSAVCEGLLAAGLQQLRQRPRQDMGHREGVAAKGMKGGDCGSEMEGLHPGVGLRCSPST